jgi:hypothetical protein
MDAGSAAFTGAAIGGVVSVLGIVLAQWWASTREERRRHSEEADRRDRDLRAAYADWFVMANRVLLSIGRTSVSPDETAALVAEMNSELAALGARVRLLETDGEARQKLGAAHDLVMRVGGHVASFSPLTSVYREGDRAATALREFEEWLVRVRFSVPSAVAP